MSSFFSKQHEYGTADLMRVKNSTQVEDDDTDGWVSQVMDSAPSKKKKKQVRYDDTEDVVPLPPPTPHKSPSSCLSKFLTGWNIFVAVLSATFVILTVIALTNKRFGDHVCPDCRVTYIVAIVVGTVVLWASLVGASGSTRSKGALHWYCGFLILCSLLSILTATTIILIDSGVFPGHVEAVWKSAIKSDKHLICQLQRKLGCSGWDTLCRDADSPNDGEEDDSPSDCPDHCEYNTWGVTCKDMLERKIKDDFPWLISLVAGITLLLWVLIAITCKVRAKYNVKDGDYQQL